MYPGEKKFYERLENARAASAKNRPASAIEDPSARDESRASTPTRRDAEKTRREKNASPPRKETPPRTPQAPRSAGGSSRASRSLRVSFEEAARESPPKTRDVSSNADGGSDPAMRRAEEAQRALRAAEAQRAAAEAAVAAARAEAERARREALLGPIPDDSESEYGTLSPLKSFASPTRASRASRSSPFASSAASPSGSAATRSSPVRSARSSLTRSFMERSGLGSSLSSSVFADDLDGAPSAPATPGAFPEDGENRVPSFDASRKGPAAPQSAPAKTTFSVFGGPLATKRAGDSPPSRRNTPPATDSRALRPPAQKTASRSPGSSRKGPETSTTEKAKAYAERVRAMAAKRSARKAAADAEAARRRADVEAERLVRESREGVSEARAGADRAKTLQRDALLYSRDMYRRAATAAFRRYYDMKDRSNASRANGAFENARFEKELVDAVKSMPAFRGLHPRYLPRLFAGASLATYRERDVVVKEGERGDFAFVLVGGECATFKRRDSAKGMESLEPDPDPWNPDARPRKTPYRVAREDDTGVPVADRNGPKRAPVLKPGWEIEAKLLGAPPGSGPFARRTRTGDLFGLGAVRGARRGEARCATLVALSETTALIIPKETFDDVIDAVQRGEAAKTAAFLRAAELFPESEVTDADLKALARALERVEAAPGDRVVTAGDVARGVFFVKEGRAEVFAKARVLVDAAGGGGVVDDAFERDKSARDELWDGSVRDSLRDSRGSLRGSLRLRRGTGTGGGAAGTPLVERVRDVPLGDLVSPAVFGEECLVPREKKAKVVGTNAPATTPSAPENEKSFGRHAFTVVAARGVGVTVLRLAPGELARLPASVARRIMQLARSTAEASAEAREALDAPPAPPPGRARDVVASAEFKKAPPPPARVGVVFGSSAKPPPSLVDPGGDGEGEGRASTAWNRSGPRDRDEGPSARRRGPFSLQKGLGGGGGRTRESDGRGGASPASYGRDSRSPPAFSSSLDTSANSTPSPYSRFMRLDAPDHVSLDDERFERTAREVTEAALREAKSAERKLRAFRESRRAKTFKNQARGDAPESLGGGGGAPARFASRAGADRARRANSAPVVRLTKKAAAIAAKNAPISISGARPRLAAGVVENRFRRGASPSAAAAAFAFDADRARGALEASSRSRERAAEARASLRDASLGRRPRREDFDDFEDAWEDAGRV